MSTTLVLGGTRTGKTRYATQLLTGRDAVTVIRASEARQTDSAEQIHGPREVTELPHGWTVANSLEVTRTILRGRTPVLVDCLGTWVLGLIDSANAWGDRTRALKITEDAAHELAALWADAPFDCVAVSHEVGMGAVPTDDRGAIYRDALGRVNAIIGAASNRVHVLIAGRVLDLTNAPLIG
ncbi:bifunctional adenosylcobinamide kinase/adenosylcobinamide-phosphate guanylyltransferase [Calidifontibacter terrae]